MKGLPFAFIATAAALLLVGMVWGIQMSATGDHTLSPAHGHLNLIGWVTMAIFGVYFTLTPHAAQTPLAKGLYGLTLVTVLVLVPGIAMAISGKGEMLAKLGSVLAVASMVLFLVILMRNGVGRRA